MSTKMRKLEHIDIALKRDVEFKKTTGFEDIGFEGVELVYKTLPEVDKKEIDCSVEFMGKGFSAPIMVSAITGGAEGTERINRDIARACQELGIGMGLGSQRAMLEHPELAYTYRVRDIAPDIFLAGNLGVVQAKNYNISDIEKVVRGIGADALALHMNAAQEAIQPDGTTDFRDCLDVIRKLSEKLGVPVFVKEVGSGVSREIAQELSKTNIKAIDIAGVGGTSWTKIEYLRSGKDNHVYSEFGIPTVMSILETRSVFKGDIIASGGIRNGLQVVKALVLGASLCGIALPILKAQNRGGSEGVKKYLDSVIDEIRTGMFLLGAKRVKDLKGMDYILTGKTREWVEQRKLV